DVAAAAAHPAAARLLHDENIAARRNDPAGQTGLGCDRHVVVDDQPRTVVHLQILESGCSGQRLRRAAVEAVQPATGIERAAVGEIATIVLSAAGTVGIGACIGKAALVIIRLAGIGRAAV